MLFAAPSEHLLLLTEVQVQYRKNQAKHMPAHACVWDMHDPSSHSSVLHQIMLKSHAQASSQMRIVQSHKNTEDHLCSADLFTLMIPAYTFKHTPHRQH